MPIATHKPPARVILTEDGLGAEKAILLSTPKAYLQRVRKIAMEYHDHLTRLKHDRLRELLEEAGFSTELKLVKGLPLGFLYGWRG